MSGGKLVRSLSFSAADALGRMGLQFLATIWFARWLAPEVFGEAALIMVAVGMLSVFVTAPFEEALSRQARVRSLHFSTALSTVLVIALLLCGLAWLAALLMPEGLNPDRWRAAARFSLVLLANGPIAILTAICRRHRRFNILAKANLAGQLIGTLVGLGLVAGLQAGVWGLLAVQFVSRFVTLLLLITGSSVRPGLEFSLPYLRTLSNFAGWHLAGRFVDAVSDVALQSIVTLAYGLSANGYLNMAMRVVEPIRGATGAIGHNIATTFFARAQDAPLRLKAVLATTLVDSSLLLFPAFLGLAATAPTIIVVLAGPAWPISGSLAVCLALGAAIGSVGNFLHSALSAQGRARIGFLAGLLDFVVTVLCLLALQPQGLIGVGVARLVPYATDLVYVSLLARRWIGLPDRLLIRRLGSLALSAAIMGLAVITLAQACAGLMPVLSLAVQIIGGGLVYLGLLGWRHRALALGLQSRLFGPGPMLDRAGGHS